MYRLDKCTFSFVSLVTEMVREELGKVSIGEPHVLYCIASQTHRLNKGIFHHVNVPQAENLKCRINIQSKQKP